MTFRYDINGLRAIAVIAVVLYHFNPAWAPGGFAGVDVFFVISGFLMTGIIFRGLEGNHFNLFRFYLARANRIIPALLVLCLTLLILGWFFLTPYDYKVLGKHLASSMGFLSNVIYLRESGYFDTASHDKWLLHTWSLSVEWQFYIIYPIFLIVLTRFLSLDNVKRIIIIGTIVGFIFSIIATLKFPVSAYYILPTRAWEMMIGGLAFLYPYNLNDKRNKIIELMGLFLIVSSYIFISNDISWPGYAAMFPVLGAYLIIFSNQQSSIITNNVIFQYLGKWSYSIYLWHWPVVVYINQFGVSDWNVYGIVVSIVLGFMSYTFIERLSWRAVSKWSDVFKVKYLYCSFLIVVVSSLIYFVDGFSPDRRLITKKMTNETFIIIGDSHGGHLIHGLSSITSGPIINYTSPGCIGLIDVDRYDYRFTKGKCAEFINKSYEQLLNEDKGGVLIISNMGPLYLEGTPFNGKDIARVTGLGVELISDKSIIDRWEVYKLGLIKTAFKLSKLKNTSVVFAIDIPELGIDYGCENKLKDRNKVIFIKEYVAEDNHGSCFYEKQVYIERTRKYKELIKATLEPYPFIKVFDPENYFCDDKYCYGYKKGVGYLYQDQDHLNKIGSQYWAIGFYHWLKGNNVVN